MGKDIIACRWTDVKTYRPPGFSGGRSQNTLKMEENAMFSVGKFEKVSDSQYFRDIKELFYADE